MLLCKLNQIKINRTSCFGHVIELVARAFLTGMSPKLKIRNDVCLLDLTPGDNTEIIMPPQEIVEDTEEDILEAMKEMETEISTARFISQSLTSDAKALLLKVRGLIAKV